MLFYIFAIVVIFLLFSRYSKRSKKCKSDNLKPFVIPGIPSDSIERNSHEIKDAVYMISFLRDLHQRLGPIVSFREGEKCAVSVASPEYFKHLRHLGNLALEILEPFRIFIGNDSLGLMNGEEAIRRRKLYDQYFQLKGCKSYTQTFLEIAHEYIDQWKKLTPDDHIPLMKTVLRATMKGILRTSYGDYFKDDSSLNYFQENFIKVTLAIEKCPAYSSPEDIVSKNCMAEIHSLIDKIIEERRKAYDYGERDLFLDVLLGNDATESQCKGDSILFIGAGYEVTGKILMWVLYELAVHRDIQEKVFEELVTVLGTESVSLETIPKLVYVRQVIDETLRLRGQTTIIGRVTEKELQLGDYTIPADTNIYQPVGLVFLDPNIWPHPEKFNPDRFSPANSKGRHPYAFKPFGFAGKRQCPGQVYAYMEITVLLAEWCRQFRIKLVPNQDIKFFEGIIIRPQEEIWVTFEKRN